MNSEEIDYLFIVMENKEYDEILKFADIEGISRQDAKDFFLENNAKIMRKIMKKIEDGDYNYFLSKKEEGSYEELTTFSNLMSHSSKIDDIKKIIENSKKLKLYHYHVTNLIAGTHDAEYIKDIINNKNGVRGKIGINLCCSEIVKLIIATEEPEYIKDCIEGREKNEYLEDARKHDLKYGSYMVDLIKATNDIDYIKQFIEDKQKGKKLGLYLSSLSAVDLIKSTKDVDYMKKIIESKKLRKEIDIESSRALSALIIATQDTEYIKSFIEDEEKRCDLGINLDGNGFARLIEATKEPEYIKSFIVDDEKRKKYELLFFGDIERLIEATKDADFIKSIIDDVEKTIKLEIEQFVPRLIVETRDVEYAKSFIRDEKKREELGLELEKIVECFSEFKADEINDFINEEIENNTNFYTPKIRELKLPENMTMGIEIESEGIYSDLIRKLTNKLEKGWKCKDDSSLYDGVEVISPILTGDTEKNTKNIYKVCQKLKILKQNVSETCGGHIHVGADYLTSGEAWMNLIDIWGNNEEIFYTISNKEGEIPRSDVSDYAKPISGNFEEMLNKGTVQLESIDDLKNFAQNAQQKERYFGINFQNLGNRKNTIEFRLPNGTTDAATWIENINLFGGIVKTSENLSQIQKKPEKERTYEDERKIEYLEKIKNGETSQEEKLEFLLELIIPEEDRDIYRRRYQVNSKLIEQNPTIKRNITEKTAKKTIDVKKIGKKIFNGKEKVTGQDYQRNNQILQNDLHRESSDLEVE